MLAKMSIEVLAHFIMTEYATSSKNARGISSTDPSFLHLPLLGRPEGIIKEAYEGTLYPVDRHRALPVQCDILPPQTL